MENQEVNPDIVKSIMNLDPSKLTDKRFVPRQWRSLPRRMRRRLVVGNIFSTLTRVKLLQPGYMRLILPPVEYGGDPLKEWKAWGDRVAKSTGRIPGSWRTRRLAKKRMRWLMRHFG